MNTGLLIFMVHDASVEPLLQRVYCRIYEQFFAGASKNCRLDFQ